jgi:hypothetical protein
MKFQLLFLTLFLVLSSNIQAIDKITLLNKESFNAKSDLNNCSTFDLGATTDDPYLKSTISWMDANSSILTYSLNSSALNICMLSEKVEKVIYQKLFYKLGIHEIEILDGDAKGVYSIDEFLNLYNL